MENTAQVPLALRFVNAHRIEAGIRRETPLDRSARCLGRRREPGVVVSVASKAAELWLDWRGLDKVTRPSGGAAGVFTTGGVFKL